MAFVSLIVLAFVPYLVHGTATFEDCGGSAKRLSMVSGSIRPDPIQYPGNVSVTMVMDVLKDLPADNLKMQLKLYKIDQGLNVPCMDGIGSCEYDVCDMLQNHKDELCPMFPAGMECKCPMKLGHYSMKNAIVVVPNFGPIFTKILKGHYNGTITFVDKASTEEVGCIKITFEIVPSV